MPTLTIDGQQITVDDGTTVLQACEQLGIEIPVFCYHPKLSIAGNCRMCLVDMEKSPKPIASCAMPATDGMVIHTDTDKVKKARHNVLEFLLINHPLDCPICDQGGECDLQDITMTYGKPQGRFELNKRAVPDKYMGPLVRTSMTRCIHCARCIRFAHEIAGVPDLGTLHRGEHSEITSYLNQTINSELSGNVIDICPVGALTSKPYAYHGRSWELTKTESIDVLDAVGSHIRIDSRGKEVMRVLPVAYEPINEVWISDRTRFAYDGLKNQRLTTPYIRTNGKLTPSTWSVVFQMIKEQINMAAPFEIAALTGDLVDAEAVMALKDLMDRIGTPHTDCRQDGGLYPTNHRGYYLFNTTIEALEDADFVLLVGTNPRTEAALINARLRKRYMQTQLPVYTIGESYPLTYPCESVSTSPLVLKEIADGSHALCKKIKKAKKPVIIIGQGALSRKDGQTIFSLCAEIAQSQGFIKEDWNGFNVLHTAAGRVGALDVGFVPGTNGYNTHQILEKTKQDVIKVLFLMGADEIPMKDIGENCFVIYQGHHGDAGAHRADIILPGCAYTEKNALYVNTEGRVQKAYAAVQAPGEAKEDWKIIRALSDVLGYSLMYDNQDQLRHRLGQNNPIFKNFYNITPEPWVNYKAGSPLPELIDSPLESSVPHFYMTDSITRHSPTMAKCHQEISLGLSTQGCGKETCA